MAYNACSAGRQHTSKPLYLAMVWRMMRSCRSMAFMAVPLSHSHRSVEPSQSVLTSVYVLPVSASDMLQQTESMQAMDMDMRMHKPNSSNMCGGQCLISLLCTCRVHLHSCMSWQALHTLD